MQQLFETVRLRVREYLESDVVTIQEYASQESVVQYANWGPNTLEDTYRFYIETQASRAQLPRQTYALSIERKEDGRQIGGCEIDLDANGTQEATIGYIIHPDCWNQGYGTEVTLGLVAFARDELAIPLIRATCDARNGASQRVLEKSGFVLERTMQDDLLQKGEMRTTLVYHQDWQDERQ